MNESMLLSWQVYGNGYPLVLIHGFGEDGTIWNEQVCFLQKKYRVIVPHLRGSGLSAALVPPQSIEQMADDIKQMLEREEVEKCIMLGHSMGGYITLAFAEKYVNNLDGLGLIHSTAYADSDEKKEARKKSIDFIRQNSAVEFVKATIPNLFAEKFKQQYPERIEELISNGKQFTQDVLIAYYKCMINRPDRTEILKHAAVPVLFFIGEEDKAVNPADAIQQTVLPPVCFVEIISNIAHMGMWEAAEQLNHSIHAFAEYIITTNRTSAKSWV